MYRLFQPSVAAVTSAPVLVIFIDEEQSGWCQRASHENVIPFGSGNQLDLYQFSEEGYAIVQVARPRDTDDRNTIARETLRVVHKLGRSWVIITWRHSGGHRLYLESPGCHKPAPQLESVHTF